MAFLNRLGLLLQTSSPDTTTDQVAQSRRVVAADLVLKPLLIILTLYLVMWGPFWILRRLGYLEKKPTKSMHTPMRRIQTL